MLVAAIDTATLVLSCALVELLPGEPVRPRRVATERAPTKPGPGMTGGHGGRLPGALEEILLKEGIPLEGVEGFAVGLGPGSFTGLRIGLATFKGLAYATKRPIAGASSLAAMALAAMRTAKEGSTLVPLLDARKGEVYAGFYRMEKASLVPLSAEVALSPEAVAERVRSLPDPVVFGEGRFAYPVFGAFPVSREEILTPGAVEVAALAMEKLLREGFDPSALFSLEPHYVRASEAEMKFPKGLGPGALP